jgi:ABC-type amino acid transport substrate-binding protein
MLTLRATPIRAAGRWLALPAIVVLVAACSSSGASPSAAASVAASEPPTAPPASAAASAAPSAAASASAGASGAAVICDGFTTVEPGTLTVATYDGEGLPDLTITNGQLGDSLEGALLNGFAKDCNLNVKLYQTQFGSMILAVQQKKADVGTDIFWTQPRSKQIYYTGPYQVADHAAIFTPKSTPYNGPSSVKTVGTVTGFVWAPYLQAALGSNAKLFPDQTTGITALLNGQIDAWVNGLTSLDSPPLSDHKNDIVATKLSAGDFGMPEAAVTNSAYQMVSCDNKGLAAAIDSEQAKQVNDGTWEQVKSRLKVTTDPTLKQPQQGC